LGYILFVFGITAISQKTQKHHKGTRNK